MVKTNQFSSKGAYVQPYCKAVQLRATQTILAGSYKQGSGLVDIDGEDVKDQTNDWGL